jgi:hypothetical protein
MISAAFPFGLIDLSARPLGGLAERWSFFSWPPPGFLPWDLSRLSILACVHTESRKHQVRFRERVKFYKKSRGQLVMLAAAAG